MAGVRVYAVDALGFSIMDNHFHLLIEVSPGDLLVDDEVRRRFILLYNKGAEFPQGRIDHFRKRFFSLSHYSWDILPRSGRFEVNRRTVA